MEDKKVTCLQCCHYFVSYDPARPHGCRAMGFKCRTSPAQVVFASSGMVCQLFASKKNATNKAQAKKTV